MNEDSVSKLKEERSASVRGDQTGRILGSGEGEQGRGFNCPHTPDNLSKDRGWRTEMSPIWKLNLRYEFYIELSL